MFRSYRSLNAKTGLIAALLFAIIFTSFLIGWGNQKSAEYERHSYANSRYYSEYTRKKIAETCVAITSIEKAKCVYEAKDQEREYYYNQTDLTAQRQSALWAYVMGLAAVIGMALSAFGVWLVKTTFDETRKSNDIARDHQRARITIELEAAASINPGIINVVVSGRNIGHSAALNCTTCAQMFTSLPKFSVITGVPSEPRNIASNTCEQTTIVFGEIKKVLECYIAGKIKYDCIFGVSHISYFCVKVIPSDLTNSGYVAKSVRPAKWPSDT